MTSWLVAPKWTFGRVTGLPGELANQRRGRIADADRLRAELGDVEEPLTAHLGDTVGVLTGHQADSASAAASAASTSSNARTQAASLTLVADGYRPPAPD